MPRNLHVSQFSDPEIPFEVAESLCGPVAAMAFARANGRNPTLSEAKELAAQVGWTAERGMAGPQSQLALLTKMGSKADMQVNVDWDRVAREAKMGQPVTISTPRHYFTISDYDSSTGRYYVGTSGTDLIGGKEWMTKDELAQAGRGVQAALHLTHTRVPSAGEPSEPPEEKPLVEAAAPTPERSGTRGYRIPGPEPVPFIEDVLKLGKPYEPYKLPKWRYG